MSYGVITRIGVFVIYNRRTSCIPEVEMLGEEWEGPGQWHFGRVGGEQFRRGFATAEEAENALESFEWATLHDQGWP